MVREKKVSETDNFSERETGESQVALTSVISSAGHMDR